MIAKSLILMPNRVRVRVPHPIFARVGPDRSARRSFKSVRSRQRALVAVALIAVAITHPVYLSAQTDASYVATQSTLTYHMSHPMHEVDGTSHAARGKGVCHAGTCDFLIAVPVKSFDSGDTNRDLHMIEATHGAQFPMIVVRAHFPQTNTTASTVSADLEVQFAGQTARYAQVPFQRADQNGQVRITGTIPLTCSDFKIDRQSFLTVPIRNEIPVRVDILWRPI